LRKYEKLTQGVQKEIPFFLMLGSSPVDLPKAREGLRDMKQRCQFFPGNFPLMAKACPHNAGALAGFPEDP
jgi:hypothetical protein